MQKPQMQDIQINDRKEIIITGVKKIKTLTENELKLQLKETKLTLLGKNLEMYMFDVTNGKVGITGEIDALCFDEALKKHKSNFIKKVFQ